eukprot:134972-Rhodomonas_salina.1
MVGVGLPVMLATVVVHRTLTRDSMPVLDVLSRSHSSCERWAIHIASHACVCSILSLSRTLKSVLLCARAEDRAPALT